jgi:hypothetical protein
MSPYNPFPLLTANLLEAKMLEGKKYFVRQTYLRGLRTGLKVSLLIKAYKADEEELAEKHMANILHDKHAYVYDSDDQQQLLKLQIAASQPEGFAIYYAGHRKNWKLPAEYQQKIRKYIHQKHPGWKTKKGGDKIQAGLYEEFGQLFLTFSFEEEADKVPFDFIEKY